MDLGHSRRLHPGRRRPAAARAAPDDQGMGPGAERERGVSALDPVLVLRDLHKSFGGTPIIRGVDLAVKRGQRHALIGPNGAGKSTLFNLISGHYTPSSGEILLNGASIAGFAPHIINRLGLSRSFQITNVFPRMSVAENLRISIMGRHGHRLTLFRPIRSLADV